jgi:FkbM family methyltransferase
MKRVLRRLIPKKQWETMSQWKRKFLISSVNFILKILPNIDLLKIKNSIDLVEKMDYEKCDIFLSIDSAIEYKTRLHSCKKEPEMIQWIETFFKEGDVFFDIGANIGAYSLAAAKCFDGRIMVYSFEPSFLNFPKLVKNLIINCCQDCIIPFQIALSDKTVLDTFNYQNLTPGGALHALGEAVNHQGKDFDPVFKQPVLSYRLDDFIKCFGLPVPNHIKIDVDGIQFSILQGAEKTLSDPALHSVLVELEENNIDSEKLLNFLSNKGLIVHSRHEILSATDQNQPYKAYNYILKR